MSAQLTITDLLKHAARYLDGDRSLAPDAPFSAALLTRESLELAFLAWGRQAIGLDLRGVGGRAQLAVLEEHVHDREIARRARFTWNELSAALHHGPGTVDPAAVRRLAVSAQRVVGGLAHDVAQHRAGETRENAPANRKGNP
jgi:hypothetical protein